MWPAYIKGILDSWKRIAQVGNQTVAAGMRASCSPDRLWMRACTFANPGIIVGLHVKMQTAGATNGKFVVAANASGVPGSVVAVTTAFTLNTTQVDMTGLAISVVSGVNYLGVVSTTGAYPALAGNYTGNILRAEGFTFASPPGTVPTLASNDSGEQLAIWADVQYDQ